MGKRINFKFTNVDAERRKHPRYQVSVEILLARGSYRYKTVTFDISLGGFGLAEDSPWGNPRETVEGVLVLKQGHQRLSFVFEAESIDIGHYRFKSISASLEAALSQMTAHIQGRRNEIAS